MADTENNKNSNSPASTSAPALRFPGFTDPWQRIRLGEITTFNKGVGISKDQRSEDGNPCILYGELYTTYTSTNIINVISKTNLPEDGLIKSVVNDVIIPSSGETAEDIATARCVLKDDVFLGGDLNIIRLNNDNGSFLCYQLNGVRKREIAKLAQGVSVVHLYKESLKSLLVSIPSTEEQTKIADFLQLLDERIAAQRRLIEDLEKLKSAIRKKVFTYLKNLNTEDVEINELLDYEQPNSYIVTSDEYIFDSTKTPVLTANKGFILGYTEEKYGIYQKGDCIIFDDFTMNAKYVTFPFKVKSSAIKILTAKSNVNLRFMFEYLHSMELKSEEHKRHYISEIATLVVAIPTIDMQNRIASILDSIDSKMAIEQQIAKGYEKEKLYLISNMFI